MKFVLWSHLVMLMLALKKLISEKERENLQPTHGNTPDITAILDFIKWFQS